MIGRWRRTVFCLLLSVGITTGTGAADMQDESNSYEEQAFGEYEPNAAYPYGRANPKAPRELQQFRFMVGNNECVDHIRQADGSWQQLQAKWNATFFMNGYGIQDKYWTDTGFVTSNIRIFNSNIGKWVVTFFSMPGYSSGVWEGLQEGKDLVMRQSGTNTDGSDYVSRLTFYNISDDGFDWVAETITGSEIVQNWKSSCKKRRG